MNTYAVDQHIAGSYTTREGRLMHFRGWKFVLQIDAPRAGSALRAADSKWPGKLHRARLIQTVLRPAPLCSDDRALIHQLTTQTI